MWDFYFYNLTFQNKYIKYNCPIITLIMSLKLKFYIISL